MPTNIRLHASYDWLQVTQQLVGHEAAYQHAESFQSKTSFMSAEERKSRSREMPAVANPQHVVDVKRIHSDIKFREGRPEGDPDDPGWQSGTASSG